LPNLGVQLLQIHRGRRRRIGSEHAGRAVEQLVLPIHNLVGVHVVHLGQLGQRLVASNGVQGHLGLENRRVVAPRSLAHGHPAFSGITPVRLVQSFHLSRCSDLRRHLSGARDDAGLRRKRLAGALADAAIGFAPQSRCP
jgi:hypothetical protein